MQQFKKGRMKMADKKEGWELRITEMDLFKGLNLDVMGEIADKCCTEESYKQGTVLFKEGEDAAYLYILVEGAVDLIVKEDTVIYSLTELSDIFGWSSLVEDAKYTASVKCKTDVKTIKIETGRKFGRIFDANSDFGLNVHRRFSGVFNKRLSRIYQKFLIAP
jgi:CRP-like cAMP-binding protein